MLAASQSTPPADLPPAPRNVTGLGGTKLSAVGFFLFPHTWIGLGLVVYSAVTLLWLLFATDVSGRVTSSRTYLVKGKTTYHVSYGWNANGEWHTREDEVPADVYASLTAQPNHPVDVRAFTLGPFDRAELEGVRSPIGITLMTMAACAFWNGIMFVMLRALVLIPMQRRRLVREGWVTGGVIVDEGLASSTQGRYRVRYAYEDKQGQRREAEMFLRSKTAAGDRKNGDRVTVLVDPERPELSTIYELSGFKVTRAS